MQISVGADRGEVPASNGTSFADVISDLRNEIANTIGPLLRDVPRLALLEFPAHSNVGDSAIWLGETAYLLDSHQQRPVHTSDLHSYSRDRLRTALDGGVILVHGGGNLGDVWPEYLNSKIQMLDDFPDTRIIQMPQTVHFQSAKNLERFQRAVARHRSYTLLVRDQTSLDLALDSFACESRLCPDLAFWLELSRSTAVHDVVWLQRTDRESVHKSTESALAAPQGIHVADWLDHDNELPSRIERKLTEVLARYPNKLSFLERQLTDMRNRAARVRLRRGCRLLSSGRVVVTDRLHGHILCTLMGIPHVLLDNSYGKLRHFYDAWTHDCSEVRFATSPEEALNLACSLGKSGHKTNR